MQPTCFYMCLCIYGLYTCLVSSINMVVCRYIWVSTNIIVYMWWQNFLFFFKCVPIFTYTCVCIGCANGCLLKYNFILVKLCIFISTIFECAGIHLYWDQSVCKCFNSGIQISIDAKTELLPKLTIRIVLFLLQLFVFF